MCRGVLAARSASVLARMCRTSSMHSLDIIVCLDLPQCEIASFPGNAHSLKDVVVQRGRFASALPSCDVPGGHSIQFILTVGKPTHGMYGSASALPLTPYPKAVTP